MQRYVINVTAITLILKIFVECKCSTDGSVDNDCDGDDGTCNCKENVVGMHCEDCKKAYFGFPDCKGMKKRYFSFICLI